MNILYLNDTYSQYFMTMTMTMTMIKYKEYKEYIC